MVNRFSFMFEQLGWSLDISIAYLFKRTSVCCSLTATTITLAFKVQSNSSQSTVWLSISSLSATIMSSGQIEDDSINRQTGSQQNLQTLVFKGYTFRHNTTGSGSLASPEQMTSPQHELADSSECHVRGQGWVAPDFNSRSKATAKTLTFFSPVGYISYILVITLKTKKTQHLDENNFNITLH